MGVEAAVISKTVSSTDRATGGVAQRRDFVPVDKLAAVVPGVASVESAVSQRTSGSSVERPSVEALSAELSDSVRVVNERLASRGQSLAIGVDQESGKVVVKVSDVSTGEVVRQIPSEDMLRLARNIEALTGILVDQKE